MRAGGTIDQIISNVSLLGISFPDFIVATLIAWVFGIVLRWFPPVALRRARSSPLETPDILVLPMLTMVVIGATYTSRMVRAGMIEVLGSDYVQTARLHGISERRVILRHALPNALAPTVQIIASTVLWLLGGRDRNRDRLQLPGHRLGARARGPDRATSSSCSRQRSSLGTLLHASSTSWQTSSIMLLVPRLRSTVAMTPTSPPLHLRSVARAGRSRLLGTGSRLQDSSSSPPSSVAVIAPHSPGRDPVGAVPGPELGLPAGHRQARPRRPQPAAARRPRAAPAGRARRHPGLRGWALRSACSPATRAVAGPQC